jgi:hypothetical protein
VNARFPGSDAEERSTAPSRSAGARLSATKKEFIMALEKPLIPTFSLKERDRRWGRLREEMKQAGFDTLIALPNQGHWDQFGCDTRYITQIGGTQTEVGCILPLEGEGREKKSPAAHGRSIYRSIVKCRARAELL